MTYKVPSYAKAKETVAGWATEFGGRLGGEETFVSDKGGSSGWMRILVPSDKLGPFLGGMAKLGSLYGERRTREDLRPRIADLAQREVRLKEHQRRLAGILESSRRLRGSDVLYVQERLFRASVDEDALRLERESLSRGSSESSVIVEMFEPGPEPVPPTTPMGHVRRAFEDAGKGLARGILGAIPGFVSLVVYGGLALLGFAVLRRPLARAAVALRDWARIQPPPGQDSQPAP